MNLLGIGKGDGEALGTGKDLHYVEVTPVGKLAVIFITGTRVTV